MARCRVAADVAASRCFCAASAAPLDLAAARAACQRCKPCCAVQCSSHSAHAATGVSQT